MRQRHWHGNGNARPAVQLLLRNDSGCSGSGERKPGSLLERRVPDAVGERVQIGAAGFGVGFSAEGLQDSHAQEVMQGGGGGGVVVVRVGAEQHRR